MKPLPLWLNVLAFFVLCTFVVLASNALLPDRLRQGVVMALIAALCVQFYFRPPFGRPDRHDVVGLPRTSSARPQPASEITPLTDERDETV